MKTLIVLLASVLLLGTAGFFLAPVWTATAKTACCGSRSFASEGQLVCTLTGETLDECCCVKEDDQFICTLTGKTLDECCCKQV